MTQFIRRIDPGVIVALAVATFAVWPLLMRAGLRTMSDAEMHVYRAAEVQYAIEDGTFYPRWAPDFYYGYGYPVFNYYSPLTYHIGAWYARLTGTDAVAGMKLVLVLAAYLGAVGMYLFARARWSAEVGVVASAAWSLSPYIMYIDPHARGDAPEAFALGLAPVLLWLYDRVRRTGSPGSLIAAAVALAALILSHPLMSLAVYGFLLAFLLWELLIAPLVPPAPERVPAPERAPVSDRVRTESPPLEPRRHLPAIAASIVLGLMLAAFYWLPAGLERSAVQLDNVAGAGFFDFRNHFIKPSELVAPSPLLDMGATEPEFRFNLGVAQALLAVLGVLTIFARRMRRLDTIFFAFAGIVLMYLMTRASQGFWEAIPPMRFFQFPTRFLGPAALAVAPLAGVAVTWVGVLPGRRPRPWACSVAVAVALIAIGVSALPLSFPKPWGEFGEVSPLRMLEVELAGRARGTTSADDFLPVDVAVVPPPVDAVLRGYENDWPDVEKLNRSTLPAGAEVTLLDASAQRDRFRVRSPDRFVFRMYRFYFPGWEARVDGEPVEIEIADPDGFITFWVPPGEHLVEVRLGPTRARAIGALISALALVGVLGMVVWAWVLAARPEDTPPPRSVVLGRVGFGLATVVIAALLILRSVAEPVGWFVHRSSGNSIVVADNQIYAGLQSEIALLGYDVAEGPLRAGERIPITLYWKAIAPPMENYRVFVHLIGQDGALYGQSDELNPAGFPTTRWPLDEYVRDEHSLIVNDDLPAGSYRLSVGLWNGDTGQRLLVYDRTGQMLGDNVELPVMLATN